MMPAPLALMLLVAGALAMLAVPFLPMWAEWRHPTDHAPLPVRADDSNAIDFFANRLRARGPTRANEQIVRGDLDTDDDARFAALLVEGDASLGARNEIVEWVHAGGTLRMGSATTALRRASAGREMQLAPECTFERLNAPRILFGREIAAMQTPVADTMPSLEIASLPGAVPRSADMTRIAGDVILAPGTRYRGSLVVTGSLAVGEGAVLSGSAKSYRGIVVGARAVVQGALVSRRNIHLLGHCRVHGPVVSEADIVIAAGAVVGSIERPTSVTGENILVEEGSIAHGSVWAHDVGVVWSPREIA